MSRNSSKPRMKTETLKNAIYDEANGVTYEVMADRMLSDGEVFLAIRSALLNSGKRPQRGETLVINFADHRAAAPRAV